MKTSDRLNLAHTCIRALWPLRHDPRYPQAKGYIRAWVAECKRLMYLQELGI